jgi:hypothetical protein
MNLSITRDRSLPRAHRSPSRAGWLTVTTLQIQSPPPFPRALYLIECGTTLDNNVDDALVFDCGTQASTAAGCTTTGMSQNGASSCGDQVTIWYPCPNPSPSPTPTDTNCCYLPAAPGGSTPFNAWCTSTGPSSFIISEEITLQEEP